MENVEIPLNLKQQKMHCDFFVSTRNAIENGMYLEAIFKEYAAIEGRLEVILGLLGYPCNQFLDDKKRQRVQISDRVECLKKIYNKKDNRTIKNKLPECFFTKNGVVTKWIKERNAYIHGLYKNGEDYQKRLYKSREIAESGMKIADYLYKEANRLKRIKKDNPELFQGCFRCPGKECCIDKKEQRAVCPVCGLQL